jgi:hypothetical protein
MPVKAGAVVAAAEGKASMDMALAGLKSGQTLNAELSTLNFQSWTFNAQLSTSNIERRKDPLPFNVGR